MWLETLTIIANQRRRTIVLAGLLITFAGVALLIDRPKEAVLEWLGLPLLVFGGTLLLLTVWTPSRPSRDASTSVADRLLRNLTWDGRLVPFFPAIGSAIIIADLVYNVTLSSTPALQTEDTIVLLGSFSLLGYRFVPDRFARERDFVLLFFLCLNAILVVPLIAARAYFADANRSVDLYSWVALAPEASALLSLLGVGNSVHAVAGSTAPGLTFTPQHLPVQVTVVITTACSGIYSFGIFASAFAAFALTEYRRLSHRVWITLALGLGASYLANVLRMVIIVLVGYYTDTAETDLQNMLIAHSYAGWIIFLAWVGLFWGILLKSVPGNATKPGETPTRTSTGRQAETRCSVCGDALTPAIPAGRCVCGAFYHSACLDNAPCPDCGRLTSVQGRASQAG